MHYSRNATHPDWEIDDDADLLKIDSSAVADG